MGRFTTYMGEDFDPFAPDASQIHMEDIAHALSLRCRANGHFVRFYSVAQHAINCAGEAKARGLSAKVQTACLLHDASEAYLSDITRPVKPRLSKYLEAEKRLQDVIYGKFLDSPLSDEEIAHVEKIDRDMLACEFRALMRKKVPDDCPNLSNQPSFEFCGFIEIEKEFLKIFSKTKTLPKAKPCGLTAQVAEMENELESKDKTAILDYVKTNKVFELLTEKLDIKKLSIQVDVAIHAYGILSVLPKILEDGEVVEYLSLGADNTGKPFDVSTSKRIAEFKFARWDGGSNAIRKNGIFKDFLCLAMNADGGGRQKFIYCLNAVAVTHFLRNSRRTLDSVLPGNPLKVKYPEYRERYRTVKAFYQDYKDEVKIVEIGGYIGVE